MVSNTSVRNRVQMFEPRSSSASVNSESEGSSEIPAPPAVGKNVALDWPMEDEPGVKAPPSSLRLKPQPTFSADPKNVDTIHQRGLHQSETPASTVEKSPFQLIMNRELKISGVARESDLAVKKETREVTWPSPKKEEDRRDDEPVVDAPPDPFSSNDEENNAPVTSRQSESEAANPRSRTTRAMRLIRSKKVVQKTRYAELKVSLDAASIVMEEEKSNAGSSNASSRSSLSNHELSNIAHRALTLAKSKVEQRSSAPPDSAKPSGSNSSGLATPTRVSRASKLAQTLRRGAASTTPVSEPTRTPETIDGPRGFEVSSQHTARHPKNDDVSDCSSVHSEHSRSSISKVRPGLVAAVRRTRTVSNVSHQEARKALLNAAQKKKEKYTAESHDQALLRLGSRASRVVALKKSTDVLVSKPEIVEVVEEQEKTTIAPVQVDRQSRPVQRREQHFDDACSVVSNASVDSKASRRSQHPAFAARSPVASRGERTNSFSDNDRENRSVSELEYESSKPRPSSAERDNGKPHAQHFKNGTGDRRDPHNGVNPPGTSFEEESRHQTRNDAPSSQPSRNDGHEHGTRSTSSISSSSSIFQSISHDVHPAERPSPSTVRDTLAAVQGWSLSQPKSLNQVVDLMGTDLAPAAPEQDSAHSNPVGSFYGMGRSRYASKQPWNIGPRDSMGDPPEVIENPELSSPGRSVRSLRSVRSVSPPGRGPIFPSEFDYLTKKPSKQSSVDADPIKITSPKRRPKLSISDELDQDQSSRDHATRVNRNFDGIEPKQSWKSSGPPGCVLSTIDSDDVDEDKAQVPHPKEGYSIPEELFGGDNESDSDFEDVVSFHAELKLGNLKADAEIQIQGDTSENGNRDSMKRRARKDKNKSHGGTANSVFTKDASLKSDNSHYTEPTVPSSADSSSKFKLDKGHSKLQRRNEPNEDQTQDVATVEHVETIDAEEIPKNDTSMKPDSLFGSLVEITTTATTATTAPSSPVSKLISLNVDTGGNESHQSNNSRKATKTPDATAKSGTEEKSQNSSHTSKSESSRWWKNKKGGMKMANVIKQAFTKAKEPRTPSKQTKEYSNDEDDVFCGLEDDNIAKLVAQADEKTREGDTTVSEALVRTQPSEIPQSEQIEFIVAATPGSATEYSNDRTDRSGTELDKSVVEPVNSDITSSLVAGGGPCKWPALCEGNAPEADLSKETQSPTEDKPEDKPDDKPEDKPDDKPDEKVPATADNSPGGPAIADSAMTKSVSSRKSSTKTKITATTKTIETSTIDAKSSRPPKPPTKKNGDSAETKEATDEGSVDNSILGSGAPPPSLFMKFGCGIVDSFTTGVTSGVCKSDMFDTANLPSFVTAFEDGTDKSVVSGTDSTNIPNIASQMTDLEQQVWTDWDRRDSSPVKDGNGNANSAETKKKKEANEKKREAARDKLLGYGNSAISTQMSASKGLFGSSSEYTGDYSSYTGSSYSESEYDTTTRGDSKSYYSATTDMFSDVESTVVSPSERGQSSLVVDVGSKLSFPTKPILLSFSQRSLVEKFTKQLGTDAVEVLKLNSRNQWQVRYFTVSKEQIALTAHEAKSKSGDTAQCPKALLWLKKFSHKNGGYGLTNIDKSGHGGMMIVELNDVSVSNKRDLETPLPKKLQSKFKDSVLVTLDYTMNGGFRSVAFRCKNNDDAQFLCTCLRVIRDLLKREQFLRLRPPE